MSEVRLIDANALKEKINAFYDKLFVGCVSSDLIAYASGVDEIIDNAPTVSEITKEKLSIAYDQGYEDGKNNWLQEERPQGEYKTACNVLLSLEQIVRRSDGWEDSAVEAVHNAIQTAIKALEIVDDVNHKVYRNENCPQKHKCYDYQGYHCAGCSWEKKGGAK